MWLDRLPKLQTYCRAKAISDLFKVIFYNGCLHADAMETISEWLCAALHGHPSGNNMIFKLENALFCDRNL